MRLLRTAKNKYKFVKCSQNNHNVVEQQEKRNGENMKKFMKNSKDEEIISFFFGAFDIFNIFYGLRSFSNILMRKKLWKDLKEHSWDFIWYFALFYCLLTEWVQCKLC